MTNREFKAQYKKEVSRGNVVYNIFIALTIVAFAIYKLVWAYDLDTANIDPNELILASVLIITAGLILGMLAEVIYSLIIKNCVPDAVKGAYIRSVVFKTTFYLIFVILLFLIAGATIFS